MMPTNDDYILVARSEKNRLERTREGSDKPLIRIHALAWTPVLIRLPVKRWVWGKQYTRWYVWSEKQGRYRTFRTELGWS